ncbi:MULTISPECIES: outer membrane protein assembly factor BamD [Sphingomonas]|uniref:Outer membrane protein assembly factor BamD n=1 Tax=Sphingomonas lycopersici TaxID=2951807 RepID=A0AA41ZHQ6_9SPHN|nr:MULTISPECIES: outer membrane protein assembly factor BamD [Sphingomonas]MCW6532017.1 outer membrane protein assembly factor BamD [Sphingomonas lycopersici]MCW6535903.1 outer membrane protein assembly factor BamD [Sphingomonas lycopersici]OJU15357.1 MAG: outer membrane protein assembly factor BamD [Sphingomonas sp. 66-10]
MRTSFPRSLGLVLVAALALPIAGCARNRAKGDLPYVARDVGTLYTAAKHRLEQHRYKEAAALFDEVERQHPYSVWARRAQLMGAFSHYLARSYTDAIQSAQRFISVHPGNKDAPYAYYLIALCYYEQISDVTRDQKISAQAQDALGELIRRYPNSRYAADARLKIDLVRDHLAGKEMEIGRFYERRGQWLAATLRFRKVVDDYQTTTHTPEALMRLTETYLALGVRGEAEKAAAVLGANYPGTDWYARAYKLVKEYPPTAIAPLAPGQLVVPVATKPAATPGSAAPAAPTAEPPAAPTAAPTPAPAPATPSSDAPKA